MGNLLCCDPEEPNKPRAFTDNNGNYQTNNYENAADNLGSHQNFSSDHLRSVGSASQTPHNQTGTTGQDANSTNNANNANTNSIQFEEQQRALLQERLERRLERIVNDAGRGMIHISGGVAARAAGSSSAGGMVMGSSMGGRGGYYYDKNYAEKVWDHLMGTGRGGAGGGLKARCQEFGNDAVAKEAKVVLGSVPKGALRDGQDVMEVMRGGGETAREQLELLMKDDRAENFLASVFQEEGGFQNFAAGSGLPIVEYVL